MKRKSLIFNLLRAIKLFPEYLLNVGYFYINSQDYAHLKRYENKK